MSLSDCFMFPHTASLPAPSESRLQVWVLLAQLLTRCQRDRGEWKPARRRAGSIQRRRFESPGSISFQKQRRVCGQHTKQTVNTFTEAARAVELAGDPKMNEDVVSGNTHRAGFLMLGHTFSFTSALRGRWEISESEIWWFGQIIANPICADRYHRRPVIKMFFL